MNKKTKIARGAAFALTAAAPLLKKQKAKKQTDYTRKKGIYETTFKRPLDIACALGAMTVFSPLYLGTALAVKIKLGSPIIFTQERPGKDEKIFKLYKFRTMTDERDEEGNLLSDEVRLTKFGRLLRSTSFDELPEAWNILKGDMSVVGPRPLLVEYLPYYTEEEHHRHDVRPGLTGWAQVNGRNAVSWDKKLALDLEYVSEINFSKDFLIVILTVIKSIKRSDIQVGSEFKAGKFIEQRKEKMKKKEVEQCS